jgi:short subunit dehydrogenase-like uncharacterized protein
MTSPVVSNELYVILGATGNTGSIVADVLLSKGNKVRVVGRDSGRLKPFVNKARRRSRLISVMPLRSPKS